jgi:predicted kinase
LYQFKSDINNNMKKSFEDYILEGVNDPDIFKVIFLAGGPGSGKSYVVDRATGGSGLVLSNSDIMFKIGIGKAGLSQKMPDDETEQRNLVRSKAKHLSNKRLRLWLDGRLGMVIDGTGHDFEKIKNQHRDFTALGYDASMIFVNTSLEVALDRNSKRDRVVPEEIVKKSWNNVQKNIGKFQTLFGGENFIVVDNNAATDADLNKVWKSVKKLLKKPVKNHVAKQWIKDQKSK